MANDPLLKDQVTRFQHPDQTHDSFQGSSLMERKRFIQKSDNVFDANEDLDLDETIPDLNAHEIQELREGMKKAPKTQYGKFVMEGGEETEDPEVIRIVSKDLKGPAHQSFNQMIQVQPPDGLI